MENWAGPPPQGSDLHGTQKSLSSQAPLIPVPRMQPRSRRVQGQPSLDICSGEGGLGFRNVLLRNTGLAGLTVCV